MTLSTEFYLRYSTPSYRSAHVIEDLSGEMLPLGMSEDPKIVVREFSI